jgi:hypothetical protein
MQLEQHLRELETSLHRQDVRADATRLAELIADDFYEFGVSGTIWTKPAVIDALRDEAFSRREISDFKLTLLAEGVALVTYRGHRFATEQRPAADSLRSSIWKLHGDRWQMLFHQGTVLP